MLIREGSVKIQGAYMGASAAPGKRGCELTEAYAVEMESYIRTLKGEKMGGINLMQLHLKARKNALRVVKDAKKEGAYKKQAPAVGGAARSGSETPSEGEVAAAQALGTYPVYRQAFNQGRQMRAYACLSDLEFCLCQQ